MAAVIELKYFNTFWLKKLKTITDVIPGSTTDSPVGSTSWTLPSPGLDDTKMNVGQEVTMPY